MIERKRKLDMYSTWEEFLNSPDYWVELDTFIKSISGIEVPMDKFVEHLEKVFEDKYKK